MTRWNRRRKTVEKHQKIRRKILWGIGILVGLYLIVPLVVGDMGLVKYFTMRHAYHRLRLEIQQLSEDNKKIEEEIHALRSDPVKIEKLARKRLGLVRPGEVVYQFEPSSEDVSENSAEPSRP